MSGVGLYLRQVWAKEPVVCFACVIGAVGVMLPVTVPKVWGRYPDQIEADARREEAEKIRRQALKREGLE